MMTLLDNDLVKNERPPSTLLMLNAEDVTSLLDLSSAVESQRHAFGELGAGRAQLAERLLLNGPDDSVSFCYASRVSIDDGAVTKFGSMVPSNARRGHPVVTAIVIALHPITGAPEAIIDGTALTTARTAAASAVAAAELCSEGADTLAVIGSGVQAQAHIRAIAHTVPLSRVTLWSPTRENAQSARDALGDLGITIDIADDAESAVRSAAIVAACTTSTEPVLHASWLSPGSLVISVGSFSPDRHEVGVDLIAAVRTVIVDHVPTALQHAGPIAAAVASGALDPDEIVSLGEVIATGRCVRKSGDDIVFYNSVGIGIQDAAAAHAVIVNAREQGRGTTLSW